MVVFSNQALGPAVDLLVSEDVARELLAEVAAAGQRIMDSLAPARWEHELVRWLANRADATPVALDVCDIAWTPQHFDHQRAFLIAAIDQALVTSRQPRALGRWRQMIEAHPHQAVSVGRRWQWHASEITA